MRYTNRYLNHPNNTKYGRLFLHHKENGETLRARHLCQIKCSKPKSLQSLCVLGPQDLDARSFHESFCHPSYLYLKLSMCAISDLAKQVLY